MSTVVHQVALVREALSLQPPSPSPRSTRAAQQRRPVSAVGMSSSQSTASQHHPWTTCTGTWPGRRAATSLW